MSRVPVNGSKVLIASAYEDTVAISAISNASSAVAALASGHGAVVGKFIEIVTSGWGAIASRVFRISVVSSDNVTLEGLDTTSTVNFPAGEGVGTARVIDTWSEVQQINELNISGGEQQYEQGQYIDNPTQFRYPTNKTPIDASFKVDQDLSLASWTHVQASENSQSNRAFRLIDAAGIPRMLGTGIWSYSAGPEVALNSVYKRSIGIAFAAKLVEYNS